MQVQKLTNVVEFKVDTASYRKAKKAVENMKRLEDQVKGNASKAKAGSDTVEKNRLAAQRLLNEAKRKERDEEKRINQEKQRGERAANTLYNTQTRLRNLTHLTDIEQAGVYHQAGKTVAMYERGEISIQRQNALLRRQVQEATLLNRLRTKEQRTAKENRFIDRVGSRLGGIGMGALGALGLAGGGALAAGAVYGKARDTINEVGTTQGELVSRAKQGDVDINLIRAFSAYATQNGIDSGMGEQGQRKLLDNAKDVQDRLGNSLNNSTYDEKAKKWKGGDSNVDQVMTDYGYTKDDLRKFAKDPLAFVSSVVNTMEKAGKGYTEIFNTVESFADDLALYTKGIQNNAAGIRQSAEELAKNNGLLSDAQQAQILQYHKASQALDQITDSNKLAFFSGFMQKLDPKGVEEFTQAMRDLNPVFEKLGKASGDILSGFMHLGSWIAKHIAGSVADDSKAPVVTPETRKEMDTRSNSYTDQKYGVDSNKPAPEKGTDWANDIRNWFSGLVGTPANNAPAPTTPKDTFDPSQYSAKGQSDAVMNTLGKNPVFNVNVSTVVPDGAFTINQNWNGPALDNLVDSRISTSLDTFEGKMTRNVQQSFGI